MTWQWKIAAVVFSALTVATATGQNSSLYEQARQEVQANAAGDESGRVKSDTPVVVRSLIAAPKSQPRAFTKHQLITIIISERTSYSTTEELSTERDSSIDAKLDAWVRLHLGTSGMIQP
ncbi:MAG: hypothetical protein HQ546_00915, partial [Planctomycetes bacterium]|nr:hypothetical protein [Planctomycetota bacterium]